jgi:uncharacterized protein
MSDFFTPKKPKKDLWYKEPWMLLVVGGPVIVVIAAIITGVIAWQGSDKVVSKDYYKQGVNINKDIYRDAKASEYKILATAKFDASTGKVFLNLEGSTALPASVLFSFTSASGTSEYEPIQKISLSQTQSGMYEGLIKPASTSDSLNLNLWHVQVEGTDWRLTADWHDPAHTSLQLKP